MKTLRKITYIFLLSFMVAATYSCSKDDNGGDGGTAAEGTITFKANGTSVTTLSLTTSASISHNVLIMLGSSADTNPKGISLNIMGVDGPGTYVIDGSVSSSIATYSEYVVDMDNPTNTEVRLWAAPYGEGVNKVGEIKISELTDTKVIGTFNFEGARFDDNGEIIDKVNVTSGAFNINLTGS